MMPQKSKKSEKEEEEGLNKDGYCNCVKCIIKRVEFEKNRYGYIPKMEKVPPNSHSIQEIEEMIEDAEEKFEKEGWYDNNYITEGLGVIRVRGKFIQAAGNEHENLKEGEQWFRIIKVDADDGKWPVKYIY